MSFFCTKIHKWRGSYNRIVSISCDGLSTYDTEKATLTNSWEWKDIENVEADKPGSSVFNVIVRNGK